MSAYLQLLRRNPDFANLWVAQVISLLGDWFNTIVLSALVSAYSGGSGLAVSAFLLARFVPPLLIGPLAGVLVDRMDRRRLLIISDVARAVVVLLFLLATGPDRLWLIYLLTVIQFSLSAVFEPGRSAILPSLLPPQDLVHANTLGSITWSVMLAVGAIAGGLVAAVLGSAAALIVDAATFLLSAVFISRIRLLPHSHPARADVPPDQPDDQRRLIDGLRYLAAHPGTAAVLLVKLGQSLGNVDALVIIYATELFIMGQDSTTPLSIMYTAFGVGAVLGPLLTNRINDGSVGQMRRLIGLGFAWITLGWLVFGGASTLALVSGALVLRAMGGSINWTYSSVIIQKSVPDQFLGRVFSLDMAGFQLASVISTIITGLVIETLGSQQVRQVVIGLGLISLVPFAGWVLIVYLIERRQRRQALAVAAPQQP